MRLNMKTGAVALVIALSVVTAGVGVNQVWAQDATATPAATTEGAMPARNAAVRQAGLDAAAKALGMSADDLSDQLWGGKTLADLAKEANVELSVVRQAVEDATKASRQEELKAFVDEQLKAGKITQEHADWITQGIDNGWFGMGPMGGGFGMNGLGGFGDFGMGMGRGARGMNHRMQPPKQAPDQSDSGDSTN